MLVLLVLAPCLFGGCRPSYLYSFETIVSEDGSILRTITFGHDTEQGEKVPVDEETVEESGDRAEDETDAGEAVEPAEPEIEGKTPELSAQEELELRRSLPDALILPNRKRFDEYELSEDGLAGTWRSDGRIHTDFRYVTPSYTASHDPISKPTEPVHMPFTVREAYNEGRVTVTDLGLVKTINYSEKFHDFYTREEFEEYGDMLVEIHAGLFLDAVRDQLIEEYDVREFYGVVANRGVPLVKRWKEYFYREFVIGPAEPLEGSEPEQPGQANIADLLTAEKLALTHDLMELGIVDDPHFDSELLIEKGRAWIIEWMSTEIWKRHTDDENGEETDEDVDEEDEVSEEEERTEEAEAPSAVEVEEVDAEADDEDEMYLSISEIEQFFEDDFADVYNEYVKRRYGTDEFFLRHVANIYQSFAEERGHAFKLTTTMPGQVLRVLPEAQSVEQGDNGTVVRWAFDEKSFFPNGVLLSAVSVVPNEDAQKRLYGEVVLADPEAMRRYVVLMLQLTLEQRKYFLEELQANIEGGSLDEFLGGLRERYPTDTGDDEPVPEPDIEPINELTELLEALRR